ncbi:uncharacterized protein A4U43_C08F20780 [Asparagus officinalis]|nr:uncharacterized protein A4U43_C08F20780 [Asparagus officinalis]
MGMICKKSEMTSVKEMPVLQDGTPPGGFAPVRYARRITKGPSIVVIFLAAFGAFSWGMYQVGKGNKIRSRIQIHKPIRGFKREFFLCTGNLMVNFSMVS